MAEGGDQFVLGQTALVLTSDLLQAIASAGSGHNFGFLQVVTLSGDNHSNFVIAQLAFAASITTDTLLDALASLGAGSSSLNDNITQLVAQGSSLTVLGSIATDGAVVDVHAGLNTGGGHVGLPVGLGIVVGQHLDVNFLHVAAVEALVTLEAQFSTGGQDVQDQAGRIRIVMRQHVNIVVLLLLVAVLTIADVRSPTLRGASGLVDLVGLPVMAQSVNNVGLVRSIQGVLAAFILTNVVVVTLLSAVGLHVQDMLPSMAQSVNSAALLGVATAIGADPLLETSGIAGGRNDLVHAHGMLSLGQNFLTGVLITGGADPEVQAILGAGSSVGQVVIQGLLVGLFLDHNILLGVAILTGLMTNTSLGTGSLLQNLPVHPSVARSGTNDDFAAVDHITQLALAVSFVAIFQTGFPLLGNMVPVVGILVLNNTVVRVLTTADGALPVIAVTSLNTGGSLRSNVLGVVVTSLGVNRQLAVVLSPVTDSALPAIGMASFLTSGSLGFDVFQVSLVGVESISALGVLDVLGSVATLDRASVLGSALSLAGVGGHDVNEHREVMTIGFNEVVLLLLAANSTGVRRIAFGGAGGLHDILLFPVMLAGSSNSVQLLFVAAGALVQIVAVLATSGINLLLELQGVASSRKGFGLGLGAVGNRADIGLVTILGTGGLHGLSDLPGVVGLDDHVSSRDDVASQVQVSAASTTLMALNAILGAGGFHASNGGQILVVVRIDTGAAGEVNLVVVVAVLVLALVNGQGAFSGAGACLHRRTLFTLAANFCHCACANTNHQHSEQRHKDEFPLFHCVFLRFLSYITAQARGYTDSSCRGGFGMGWPKPFPHTYRQLGNRLIQMCFVG